MSERGTWQDWQIAAGCLALDDCKRVISRLREGEDIPEKEALRLYRRIELIETGAARTLVHEALLALELAVTCRDCDGTGIREERHDACSPPEPGEFVTCECWRRLQAATVKLRGEQP